MIAKNLSLIFALVESIIWLTQLSNYLSRISSLSRKQGKSRIRFLILALCFIVFNLLFILTPEIFGTNTLRTKIVLHLSGLFVATAYLAYVVKDNKIFDVISGSKNLVAGGAVSLFASYLTSFFLFGTSETARTTMMILPIIVSMLLCIYAHTQLKRMENSIRINKVNLYLGYFGILLMTSLPFIIHINVCNEVSVSLINTSFMLLAGVYFYTLSQENKEQFVALTNYGFYTDISALEKYNLTKREIEIAKLILDGKSFKEIGEILFISTRTATKHASNFYPKVGCTTKEEFIKLYGNSTLNQ